MPHYTVTVVGLGKIGLPLALQIASRGASVIGVDTNPTVVEMVSAGTPPFPNEPELDERLCAALGDGSFSATADTGAAVSASDVVIVVVPLVVDTTDRPDFTYLDNATAAIGPALTPGTLVSYETTLPVGTTRDRFAPALSSVSGLTPGENLFVCHSPERVSSGRVFADLRRYPKLVGGIDEESARRACEFYSSVLEFDHRTDLSRENGVWDVGSAEAAELTKLAETTYRDVNIALANEFARYADRIGVDVYSVIEAANSQPFSHIHRPGIAVGGHCIPVYPRLYLSTDPTAQMPATSRRVNDAMPSYAVSLLEDAFGGLTGAKVVVLGAAFRGGVKETAFSGVFPIVNELLARGAVPVVHDPLYSEEELRELGLEPYDFGDRCDAAILHTDHEVYRATSPADLPGAKVLIDGRAWTDAARWVGVRRIVLGAT